MTLSVITVPCLVDNYAYILQCSETGVAAVVDVPDAAPIQAVLDAQGLKLDHIFITHHHFDHIDGVDTLREATGARVYGALADKHRLPSLDVALSEGDTVSLGASEAVIVDVPGHTVGHIAFWFKRDAAVFSADSLMALGCGRIFEGTQPMMWETMQTFMAMPPETLVYSGHEYTASNAKFALSIEPDNAELKARAADIEATRAKGGFTVPASIELELATNPFMRANLASVKAVLDMKDASDAEVFGEIRTRKDNF
jgi:hydroxyacylglutathione hydrolase